MNPHAPPVSPAGRNPEPMNTMTKAERKRWKESAKHFTPSVRATVIGCKRDFYEIALRDLRHHRGDWRPVYFCGLLRNLTRPAIESMRLP